MKEIQSHPHLRLSEHLAEIRAAASAIFGRHSRRLLVSFPELSVWFEDVVSLHDSGKACPQFQAYIPAPDKYRGPKEEKAHTPLSTLFALHHGKEAKWDWRRTLAVAQVAAGHHSEFRDLDTLDSMLCAKFCDILVRQLAGLDHDALDRAVGRMLPRFPGMQVEDAIDEASNFLSFDCREQLDAFALSEAVRYRLLVQLVFSVLLEADKAFLAVPAGDRARYLAPRSAPLAPSRVQELLANKPTAVINDLRGDARAAMTAGMARETGQVLTMTLPTGTGKTLLAATWALETREKLRRIDGKPPLILIVLPFLTVIEQTATEYEQLFPAASAGEITNYHSLSDRTFDRGLEEESQDFFLDTWRSDIVITTFDQFLYALLSPKGKHQMRFHHLADAVVVLDEVQAFPCILWEPLRHALAELSRLGSLHVLAMSATQPGFLPDARELIAEPDGFFGRMSRYRIVLRHRSPMALSAFVMECRSRLAKDWKGQRVMLTLNTRRSARRVREALVSDAKRLGFQVEFLTADVTPADRLEAVKRIKACCENGKSCLVVSTQCVEAGVDIDLDFVVRDFGPLDSLIQIAGRCNRNGSLERGIVEIVRLLDDDSEHKKEFANQVYDGVLLDATHATLGRTEIIDEETIYPLTLDYFQQLKNRKDTGEKALTDWAYWREMEDSVRTMLRGPNRPQVTFVVIERDPGLQTKLESASAKNDRWERRTALRALAGRIARVSVSVYARNNFDPAQFGEPFPANAERENLWFWLLKPGYYSAERGIDFGDTVGDAIWGEII